jgi:transcriptional regulator with XRE-family HTH domain
MSEVEWLNIFGDNLREILEDYRITQRELADMAGLSEATISKYICKTQMPGIKAIINISEALNMSIDDLIFFGETIR